MHIRLVGDGDYWHAQMEMKLREFSAEAVVVYRPTPENPPIIENRHLEEEPKILEGEQKIYLSEPEGKELLRQLYPPPSPYRGLMEIPQLGVIETANPFAKSLGVKAGMSMRKAIRKLGEIAEEEKYSLVFLPSRRDLYEAEMDRIIKQYVENEVDTIDLKFADEFFTTATKKAEEQISKGAKIAQRIQNEIYRNEGLTISFGVGPSYVLAKVASGYKKPKLKGLTAVEPEDVQNFLNPLPVDELPGIGEATKRKLVKYSVDTVRKLSLLSYKDIFDILYQETKEHMRWFTNKLIALSHGVDPEGFLVDYIGKTISGSRKLPKPEPLANLQPIELRDASGRLLYLEKFPARRYLDNLIDKVWGTATSLKRGVGAVGPILDVVVERRLKPNNQIYRTTMAGYDWLKWIKEKWPVKYEMPERKKIFAQPQIDKNVVQPSFYELLQSWQKSLEEAARVSHADVKISAVGVYFSRLSLIQTNTLPNA